MFTLQPKPADSFASRKLSWTGQVKAVALNVLPAGIEQASVGVRRGRLALYLYKDIDRITLVSDVSGGVVITCVPSSLGPEAYLTFL